MRSKKLIDMLAPGVVDPAYTMNIRPRRSPLGFAWLAVVCVLLSMAPSSSGDDTDTDGDGMEDWFEIQEGFDPNDPWDGLYGDADADGLTNGEERQYNTDLYDQDTDDDGLSDYYDVKISGTDPNNADCDGDCINDGLEVHWGLDPNTCDPVDPDGDRLLSADENAHRTNPHNADTDGDGANDYNEVNAVRPTDPRVADQNPVGGPTVRSWY